MTNKKISIKSTLLKLFNEGKTEAEALEEVFKIHNSRDISENTVNKWYEKFRLKNQDLDDSKATSSRKKLSNEFIIDLINKNPKLNVEKLAELAGVSSRTMFSRIKELNGDGRLNYSNKNNTKFTDEFLIDLINKNPTLTMSKLAALVGTSTITISNRIKQINNENERISYSFKDNFKFTDEFLIDLVNNNPELNMTELAKLAGTSRDTIANRIKQINSDGIRVNYVKKKYIPDGYNTPTTKITYEFLADLINNNPDLNMEELAELAGVSAATINRRINKFNKAGKTLNYCNKDKKKLTDEFLTDLINNNPELNMEKLARLADVSLYTISNRIKQLSISGERVNYSYKDSKLTDKSIIDLVNENPELNLKELAEIAGISATTLSRRIKKINSDGIVANYTTKLKSKQKLNTGEK